MVKIKIKQEIVRGHEAKASKQLYLLDDTEIKNCVQSSEDPPINRRKRGRFRKRNRIGKRCDLCGKYRRDLTNLKLNSQNIRYNLIFMTAIERDLISEDEVSEFWRHERCSICPNHFLETCETILEMLEVQNPEEIRRASLYLIDGAVKKMNSMHEGEQEMNESTFMKLAQDFTMKYWSKKDKKNKEKVTESGQNQEGDESVQDLIPHFAESSSDEIPEDQLMKICKEELPNLLGFMKPKKEKLSKLKTKKPRKNAGRCFFCGKQFSIKTSIFGQNPREKLFLLLATVENKNFPVERTKLEFNADQWNVICQKHLSAASKDILTMLGAVDSSEIAKIPMDSVEKLWEKAQKIQEGSDLILIKTVEQFLEELKNFVGLYECLDL